MTLAEFKTLSFEDKYNYIISEPGIRLISLRKYYNQTVVLWDCGDFFAETYSLTTEKKMVKIEGFEQDDKKLDLYIDAMQ